MIKTKIDTEISRYAKELGLGLMTLATVVGMLELPSHTIGRAVLSSPTTSLNSNNSNQLNNPLRREKEENTIEYVSYSESQRTPSRSGKY